MLRAAPRKGVLEAEEVEDIADGGTGFVCFNSVGPSGSDPLKNPAIWVWLINHPNASLQLVKSSAAAYNGGATPERWGDYSAAVPDPSDPCRIWSHHLWVSGNGSSSTWRTWVSGLADLGCIDALLDVNNDESIDPLDAALFAQRVSQEDPRADFTMDGVVNPLDMARSMEIYTSRAP